MKFLLLLSTLALVAVSPVVAFAPAANLAFFSTRHMTARTNTLVYLSSNNTTDEQEQRNQLKQELLNSALEFQSIQSDLRNAVAEDEREADIADNKKEPDSSRFYYVKLLKRIVMKIMGRKKKTKKSRILSTDSFATLKLEVGDAGNKTIAIAEQLAILNPTPVPVYGWQGYGGGSPSDCKLDGVWKLKFTTAADATFPPNAKRGNATTSQEVDASAGTLTNVVDFEKGKTKGFRVVVGGKAVSDTEMELLFKRVVIFRNSRILSKVVFPIPTRLFRLLNKVASRGKASKRGPYFTLLYVDDDLRMHKTGEGNYFIQSRIS